VDLLRAINIRIAAVLGADFQLGQSNFWGIAGETAKDVAASLIAAFDFRIVSTLKLAMQDDDGALAAVLRAGTLEAPRGGTTAAAYWRKGDPNLGTYASARLHLREQSRLPIEEAIAELLRQAGK